MYLKNKHTIAICFWLFIGIKSSFCNPLGRIFENIDKYGAVTFCINLRTQNILSHLDSLQVKHALEYDPSNRQAISKIEIPFTESWFVVISEESYLLKSPFRDAPVFINANDEDPKWQITRPSEAEVVVRDIDLNIEYGFIAGQLIKIIENNRELNVASGNGKILSISETVGKRTVNWLKFEYDELGNILSFSSGPIEFDFKYSPNFILAEVLATLAAQRINFKFEYNTEGLLASVRQNGQIIRQFTWGKAENIPIEYGLSQPDYLPPVRLIHDGTYSYVSGISRKGMNLIRIDASGLEERLIFNPYTETIILVDSTGQETLHNLNEFNGGLGVN